MAVIRRTGFGTVFEVENEKVGIGTTGNQTNNVQVLGETKASGALIAGFSTFTTYQGFVDSNAEFGNSNIDINSQSGTLGDIEICHGDFNVSSASTLTSSVNELTVTNSFSVPTGNTDSRVHCRTAGSMRFNEDLGTLEFYTGDVWKTVNSFADSGNRGRGFYVGGRRGNPSQSTTRDMQFFNLSSGGNTNTFGVMTGQRQGCSGCVSDQIRGIISGDAGDTNVMDYITMASEGNASDFGDLTEPRYSQGNVSSSTRGILAGGWTPNNTNIMDYVEIQTLGNALDFGDLSEGGNHGNPGCQSPVRGIFGGGYASFTPDVNGPFTGKRLQLINQASKGNTRNFGDLTHGRARPAGGGNSVRGIWGGGYGVIHNSGEYTGYTDIIDYIQISSEGNATYFGDLMQKVGNGVEGVSSPIRFCRMGGYTAPTTVQHRIDTVIIATTGNAVDFGDMSQGRGKGGGFGDSHGGLGGF